MENNNETHNYGMETAMNIIVLVIGILAVLFAAVCIVAYFMNWVRFAMCAICGIGFLCIFLGVFMIVAPFCDCWD